MRPFFSIITATFNASASLPFLLNSLAGQTCRDFELIVQDNVSIDITLSLIESYSAQLPYISTASVPDGGIYDAWNKAVSRARGVWLLFLGADDSLYGPESLESVKRLLTSLPQQKLLMGCSLLIETEGGRPVQTIIPSPAAYHSLPEGMPLPHPALLYRREVFLRKNFSTKFRIAGDYEFLCNILKRDNFSVSPLVLSIMRTGGCSSSPQSMLRSELECLMISRKFFPNATRLKLYARICRSFVLKAVHTVLGEKSACKLADWIRIRCGKQPLWDDFAAGTSQLLSMPEKPLVSLLIATLGRRSQLQHLIASLNAQRYRNIEILVADQNPPGFLRGILETTAPDLRIRRIHVAAEGVSKARNALLPLAQGDIIAFPDDDCAYLEDTLEFVVKKFKRFPHLGGIVVGWSDHFVKRADQILFHKMNARNAFFDAGTLVQFYRREAIRDMYFDPELGPGTGLPFGCGEDTDYLLQVLARYPVEKTSEVYVLHPKPDYAQDSLNEKIYKYALGRMHLLRKHNFSFLFQLANIFFPLYCVFFEGPKAWSYRKAMFFGRLDGFFKR